MRVSHQKVPARCSRLQLRKIEDIEKEAASEVVERLSAALSAKISKASDKATAEGYITALPHLLYDKVQPYTQADHFSRRASPP